MNAGQKTLGAMVALGLAALAWASPVSAQDVICEGIDDFPCAYQSEAVALQKVPAIFKFQSRVSQAKLPLGEAVFNTVFVRVMRGAETLCLEQFSDVTVQNSVLNLEIGRNMSCELDEVLAENSGLQFQVCLGGQENCLRPLDLGASPYAVKASFASQSQNAYQADIAAQANYAHRVTADRDLLLRNTLGTGYFDFYTHPVEDVSALYDPAEYLQYTNSGFIQWTPLSSDSAMAVHIVAKDPNTDQLRSLDRFVVAANETIVRGDLTVTERGVHVTGASDITGDLTVAGLLLMGHDPTSLLGFLDALTHGIDGPLQVTGATTINAGGVHVTGDSDVQGALGVNTVTPAYSLDVSGDINFTGNLRRNGEPLAISGVQWDSNEGGDLYYDQGNVGVGTQSPVFPLDINGDVNFTGVLRRNGQVVPISPWTDNGGLIAYFGPVEAERFTATGSGSFFPDITVGANGTGMSRGSGDIRGLGARDGLRFFNDGNTLAAMMADDGTFVTAGDALVDGLGVGGSATLGTTAAAELNFAPNAGAGDGGRALTHDTGDVLVVNTGGDFAGGTRVDSGLAVQGDLTVNSTDIEFGNNDGRGDGGRAMVHGDDDTLVLNFLNDFAGDVRVDSGLSIQGDVTIDSTDLSFGGFPQRGNGGRAMVHDVNDTLVLNFENDFAGGTRIDGRLRVFGPVTAESYGDISDARIKDIAGVSDARRDLATLRQIEVTDYRLKDTRSGDARMHKKTIAQQLEKVYPQAVTQQRGIVPDIFALSDHVAFHGDRVTVSVSAKHGLEVGEQVVVEPSQGVRVWLDVVEVVDPYTVVASGWEGAEVASVFVYGRVVEDFRSVDYNAVAMLNVSATQELARKVERLEALEREMADLRAENARLRERFDDLASLREEMASIRAMCGKRTEDTCANDDDANASE